MCSCDLSPRGRLEALHWKNFIFLVYSGVTLGLNDFSAKVEPCALDLPILVILCQALLLAVNQITGIRSFLKMLKSSQDLMSIST